MEKLTVVVLLLSLAAFGVPVRSYPVEDSSPALGSSWSSGSSGSSEDAGISWLDNLWGAFFGSSESSSGFSESGGSSSIFVSESASEYSESGGSSSVSVSEYAPDSSSVSVSHSESSEGPDASWIDALIDAFFGDSESILESSGNEGSPSVSESYESGIFLQSPASSESEYIPGSSAGSALSSSSNAGVSFGGSLSFDDMASPESSESSTSSSTWSWSSSSEVLTDSEEGPFEYLGSSLTSSESSESESEESSEETLLGWLANWAL